METRSVTDGQWYLRFTGTSGTVAWELEEQGVHLILMWSVPYNLNIYNSYFGIGVVQLTTRLSRDMLPYWYDQMISRRLGRTFQRGGEGGPAILYSTLAQVLPEISF